MKKKKTIYAALTVLLTLSSCVQESPTVGGLTGMGRRIYFRSHIPSVTLTRGEVVSNENMTECRVTGFNPDDHSLIDSISGSMTPYFSDIRFVKDSEGRYVSEDTTSCVWPDSRSKLHFFAYHPSAEYMREAIDREKFSLVNYSLNADADTLFDYRLENFRVAPHISEQVDFITAYSSGKLEEGNAGIELDFKHQLARIEISAWGANDNYDFEIAGVRIGNAVSEGDFCFSSLLSGETETAAWLNSEGHQATVENIFSTGDAVVLLSKEKESHVTADDATSIMGSAGSAMVIPMTDRIEKWEGKQDPLIDVLPYKTDKLYFSVLLRVTNRNDEVAYPYPNDKDGIEVVYLAVDDEGKVIRRLYKIDDEYYTSDEKSEDLKYTDATEIRGFSWAALPVAAKWAAGKIYSYKLNYSTGIGWQDPTDPNPGEPIIERGEIPFDINVSDWVAAEDYNSDLDVPKR